MKKLIALLTVFGFLTFGIANTAFAQKDQKSAEPAATEQAAEEVAEAPAATAQAELSEDPDDSINQGLHYTLKDKFIQGGAVWMTPVLICLILGLAFVIERIFYLNLSSVNSKKLLDKIENTINTKGIAAAKDLCRDTKGPLAAVFYQGLDRYDEGLESVEKSLTSYGAVQMAKLENNMTWISLFIALAPSLGVAGGMKVALLTTVFGLITAMILQVFYNYLLTRIDAIVNDMEDATISFMDILVKNKENK